VVNLYSQRITFVYKRYGPDTYMGENLEQMFQHIAQLPDEKIKEIHPKHNQKT